ncbi:MAG: universal stress protein [Polyangiaceae bacterium]
MTSPKKILVPVDFTRGSHLTIDFARRLGASFEASLVLLHVIDVPDSASAIVPGADVGTDIAYERDLSDQCLSDLRDALIRSGFPNVTIRTEAGDPVEAILRLARESEYELIVMGTHGRTGLSRLVNASVAERVVRAAYCPVLTIHLPPEDP